MMMCLLSFPCSLNSFVILFYLFLFGVLCSFAMNMMIEFSSMDFNVYIIITDESQDLQNCLIKIGSNLSYFYFCLPSWTSVVNTKLS